MEVPDASMASEDRITSPKYRSKHSTFVLVFIQRGRIFPFGALSFSYVLTSRVSVQKKKNRLIYQASGLNPLPTSVRNRE